MAGEKGELSPGADIECFGRHKTSFDAAEESKAMSLPQESILESTDTISQKLTTVSKSSRIMKKALKLAE
jgi:hypothetical protein